jgi:hypothetical protein
MVLNRRAILATVLLSGTAVAVVASLSAPAGRVGTNASASRPHARATLAPLPATRVSPETVAIRSR